MTCSHTGRNTGQDCTYFVQPVLLISVFLPVHFIVILKWNEISADKSAVDPRVVRGGSLYGNGKMSGMRSDLRGRG